MILYQCIPKDLRARFSYQCIPKDLAVRTWTTKAVTPCGVCVSRLLPALPRNSGYHDIAVVAARSAHFLIGRDGRPRSSVAQEAHHPAVTGQAET